MLFGILKEVRVYNFKDSMKYFVTLNDNLQFTPYKVKVKSGSALNFRLCDTPGLEESQGLDVLECSYLLDGNIPDYYQASKHKIYLPKIIEDEI